MRFSQALRAGRRGHAYHCLLPRLSRSTLGRRGNASRSPLEEIPMLRGFRLTLGMVVVLAIVPVRAQAQFGYGYYPGGYAGYGWGGWGGANTVQGSMARGLGYFYNGEGIYN